jgi:hypothetical protein
MLLLIATPSVDASVALYVTALGIVLVFDESFERRQLAS